MSVRKDNKIYDNSTYCLGWFWPGIGQELFINQTKERHN